MDWNFIRQYLNSGALWDKFLRYRKFRSNILILKLSNLLVLLIIIVTLLTNYYKY